MLSLFQEDTLLDTLFNIFNKVIYQQLLEFVLLSTYFGKVKY